MVNLLTVLKMQKVIQPKGWGNFLILLAIILIIFNLIFFASFYV